MQEYAILFTVLLARPFTDETKRTKTSFFAEIVICEKK